MSAQSSSQATSLPTSQTATGGSHPTNWRTVRVAVGVAYLVCEAGILVSGSSTTSAGALISNLMFAAIGIAAFLLAYRNAMSFSAGQTARYAWILIGLMPLADALAYTAYTIPAYLGAQARNGAFIAVATAMLSASRIAAAGAFFAMVRVYRKSGLSHRLGVADYIVMAVVMVMELFALAFSGSGAQQLGGPGLAKLILITAIPLVIALLPCSVLGVIIWRYTAEMGGGLVAKAWRSTLLYGVAWLAYSMCNALVARYVHIVRGQPLPMAIMLAFVLTTWLLKGSEYLIFLGASYQYEASHGSPDLSVDLSAFPQEA